MSILNTIKLIEKSWDNKSLLDFENCFSNLNDCYLNSNDTLSSKLPNINDLKPYRAMLILLYASFYNDKLSEEINRMKNWEDWHKLPIMTDIDLLTGNIESKIFAQKNSSRVSYLSLPNSKVEFEFGPNYNKFIRKSTMNDYNLPEIEPTIYFQISENSRELEREKSGGFVEFVFLDKNLWNPKLLEYIERIILGEFERIFIHPDAILTICKSIESRGKVPSPIDVVVQGMAYKFQKNLLKEIFGGLVIEKINLSNIQVSAVRYGDSMFFNENLSCMHIENNETRVLGLWNYCNPLINYKLNHPVFSPISKKFQYENSNWETISNECYLASGGEDFQIIESEGCIFIYLSNYSEAVYNNIASTVFKGKVVYRELKRKLIPMTIPSCFVSFDK